MRLNSAAVDAELSCYKSFNDDFNFDFNLTLKYEIYKCYKFQYLISCVFFYNE